VRRANGLAGLPKAAYRFFLLAVAPALALCLLLQGARAGAAERPPSPAGDLARMLSGTFRGSSPGNDLTIVSTPLGGSPVLQLQRLEVRVTGAYQGDAVLLRGLWRISYQGDAVWLVFIPGVDPLEAARRFSDPTFSPTELEAGCWVVLVSRGRAFEGRVKTFPNCRDALRAGAVQRIDKEWSIRIAADEMRFENSETGETLSFSRAAGRKK
jgi:hypothetical protein